MVARARRDGGGEDTGLLGPTPATYSYNDALLMGKMTRAELEAVRAELSSGKQGQGDDDDADEVRTVVHLGGTVDLAQVTRQIDAGDYAGALALAERALAQDPESQAARRYADICRKMVARVYMTALGDRGDVPHLAMPEARLPSLALDRWAAFVVTRVDGQTSIDDIVDIAGLHRLDTLRILYELKQQGVIYVAGRR
jgi:hypothetical protein